MTDLTYPLVAAPGVPTAGARLLRDLPMAAGVSLLAAIVLTLGVGRPEALYEQLVFSMFIGMIGFVIVDGARLRFGLEAAGHPWRRAALAGVMLAAAPIAHFTGLHLGAAVLGQRAPSLAAYPNVGRISMVLFTFMGLAIMTALVVHRERLARIKQEHRDARLRAETIERQALQAQLRLLQAQIEPHMLFNTLANLQGLIALDPARANTMLDQLIQYLRATLGASRAERTTLGEEFAAMEAYLGLMAVRMGARLRYRLALPPELRHAPLPPMLLQPLVENAIVHGLEPTIDGGEVSIGVQAIEGMLEICVADSGLGLKEPPGAHGGGGVGMATTRERLRVLYGERARLELLPGQPQGTTVRLSLPMETA